MLALHPDDEVYAYFGAAAMAAQLFEENIVLVLKLRGHREDFERAMKLSQPIALGDHNKFDRLTLGRLVGLLEDRFNLPEQVAHQFSEALDARNQLMHGYFARNVLLLKSSEGKARMADDLDAYKEQFYQAVQTISQYVLVEGETFISTIQQRSVMRDSS